MSVRWQPAPNSYVSTDPSVLHVPAYLECPLGTSVCCEQGLYLTHMCTPGAERNTRRREITLRVLVGWKNELMM